jgi:hypothetical protein
MTSTEGQPLVLAPHPFAPTDTVRRVEARVARGSNGALTLAYCVEGEVSRICLQAPGPVHRVDGLWRHTCFEAFVASGAAPGYVELNFAPSAAWAAYAFSDYRSGMAPADDIETPAIAVAQTSAQLKVEISVGLPCLADAGARMALAAVIEETNGRLSYWALAHPPGKPDFHHSCGFALEV